MNRPLLFRFLGVGWSAVCLLCCVLLIALWVRSYWITDSIDRGSQTSSETTLVAIFSDQGTLAFYRQTVPTGTNTFPVLADQWSHHTAKPKQKVGHFLWRNRNREFVIQFPTWLPTTFLAAAAGIPWIGLKRRFSLRTLLIATTLVALALGLLVWLR